MSNRFTNVHQGSVENCELMYLTGNQFVLNNHTCRQNSTVPLFAAKSLDISTSPTLSGRPRERGVAFNMQRDNRYDWFCKFEMCVILCWAIQLIRLDAIGEKKCKKITWKDLSTSQGSSTALLCC